MKLAESSMGDHSYCEVQFFSSRRLASVGSARAYLPVRTAVPCCRAVAVLQGTFGRQFPISQMAEGTLGRHMDCHFIRHAPDGGDMVDGATLAR